MRTELFAALALGGTIASSSVLQKRSTVNPYAPYTTTCPAGSLVRPANRLSTDEHAYVKHRSHEASKALLEWLSQVWECYIAEPRDLPVIAIAMSGGGPKAGLGAAGALYGLDNRDSDSSVAGILQASTYISALSGGTLTLSGMMANNFAKISTLKMEFYNVGYEDAYTPFLPYLTLIDEDVANKTTAGYVATLVDLYGRIISYDFFGEPPGGGDNFTFSSIISQSSFLDYEAPFPIITVSNSDVPAGQCIGNDSGPVWEISPLEFGSWDAQVKGFYPTEYLGTPNNSPSGSCTTGFDNTGFLTAISSNILINQTYCSTGNYSTTSLVALALEIDEAFTTADELVNPYGIIPNPFYEDTAAGIIQSLPNLYMADGGYTGQGIPIFPWIQAERNVDVVLIIDSETNTPSNITDGSAVYETYLSAQAKGLTKMPVVPTPAQFAAQNLSTSPHFYGCYEQDKTTMVFLPNTDEDILSEFTYSAAQVQYIFTGGYDQVTASNNTEWPACLACAIMHKSPWELPDVCTGCLEEYCWSP